MIFSHFGATLPGRSFCWIAWTSLHGGSLHQECVDVASVFAVASSKSRCDMRNHRALKQISRGPDPSELVGEILRLYQDERLKMVEVARRLGITEWRVWKTL